MSSQYSFLVIPVPISLSFQCPDTGLLYDDVMKVADTGSFFLDPSVTHWDDTLTIVIPLRVSGISC
ncbi:MAG: hypothetical protein ABS808_02965 [Wolbachia endosymbiont of Polyergus mexicanus]|uniref:Uncharacterized protein n=1 Tax=Wolbachia endosymbiont of Polyergus mexicanus TaxID=3171167 RepID=A0AAU7YJ23_9RICK